jgi:hypothetical protein
VGGYTRGPTSRHVIEIVFYFIYFHPNPECQTHLQASVPPTAAVPKSYPPVASAHLRCFSNTVKQTFVDCLAMASSAKHCHTCERSQSPGLVSCLLGYIYLLNIFYRTTAWRLKSRVTASDMTQSLKQTNTGFCVGTACTATRRKRHCRHCYHLRCRTSSAT